jgi:hypothetical protein
MAKRAMYFAESERLFVQEQCTVADISSRLKLGEKTIREWKAEGKWDEKRKTYLIARQSFHEELYDFTRDLMRSIKGDMADKKPIDAGRMYTLAKLLPNIMKVKDYEDVAKAKSENQPTGALDEDVVKMIERNVLGIERSEPANE